MFCMNCGKEFPNEARFCMHCGVSVPSLAAPAASARPARPMLNDYYVVDWEGECPSCGLIHTYETSRCVNDDARIAVAFRDITSPSITRLPLHAADLRCLNDCGVRIQAFPCCQCGAVIKGKYLRFRFPNSVRNLHKLYHYTFRFLWFVLFGVLIICGVTLGSDIMAMFNFDTNTGGAPIKSNGVPPELLKQIYPFIYIRLIGFIVAFLFVSSKQNQLRWYKGKEWFNFIDVAKDLERHEKAQRFKEAIELAKATHEATKPLKLGV